MDLTAVPRTDATLSVLVSAPFVRALREAGEGAVEQRTAALRALLPRYGLSEESLAVEGARVPHALTLDLLERSAWLLGSEAIGLRGVQAWRLGDHGLGDYLNRTSATLGDMLATSCEYVGLLHDGVHLAVRVEADLAFLTCELDPDLAYHRWFPETVLGKMAAEIAHAFGAASEHGPVALHSSDRAPAYEAEYEKHLGFPVEFDCDDNALVFSAHSLEAVLPTADPVLHGLLRRQAATALGARRSRASFLEQVRLAVAEELPNTFADQGAVARRFGISPSTLRRRLEQKHGTRYADLVNDLRRDVAARELTDVTLPIDVVGSRAGFSQKTAFYRAFKRWFGCTPAEYRRARGFR